MIMKKSIALIMFISCVDVALAQDIIALRDGKSIDNITIVSVTDQTITYLENSDTLSIPYESAQAILYANGRYEEMKTQKIILTEDNSEDVNTIGVIRKTKEEELEEKRLQKEQKAREAEERKQAQKLALQQKKREEEERKQALEAEKAAALEQARFEQEQARLAKEREYQDGLIHRINANSWYYIDRYYTKKEIQSIIVTSCPDAQQYYNTAKKWVIGGWSGVGAGLAMVIVGSVLVPVGIDTGEPTGYWVDTYSYTNEWGYLTTVYGHYEYDYHSEDTFLQFTLPGIIFLTTGCAAVIASTTIACIGHHRMNNAYKVYNTSCANKQEPSLSFNIGPTRNGISLTMRF